MDEEHTKLEPGAADTQLINGHSLPAPDLRKFPLRNVRVLHSVVDLPPGGSFPLWNTARDSLFLITQ